MYADNVTGSMQRAIDETNRRRAIQQAYNQEHGITPQTVIKAVRALIGADYVAEERASYTVGAASTRAKAATPALRVFSFAEEAGAAGIAGTCKHPGPAAQDVCM
jgi:excinuclease ABC subunit B